MKKQEIIDMVTEETHWGLKKIKEEALDDLEEAADSEGCEWGDTVTTLVNFYRDLPYASDTFMLAFYNELLERCIYMYQNTEVIETPERKVEKLVSASKVREWTDR